MTFNMMSPEALELMRQRQEAQLAAREERNAQLTGLFNEYGDATRGQTITSTIANMANIATDLTAYKKSLNELQVPDYNVPGKADIRISRRDVTPRYDRAANRMLNTGVKAAREAGRMDLIPGVTRQATEIELEGQAAQNEIDIQTANAQAEMDYRTTAEFDNRLMAAETARFQTEVANQQARINLAHMFSQNMKRNTSAQADIINKAAISPIQAKVDWLATFGYIDQGIYDKQDNL